MAVRKIVVFHNTAAVGSAWTCAEGIAGTLRDMGFDVIDGGRPRKKRVSVSSLRAADLIMLGAPEWFAEPLRRRYGSVWPRLKARKAAWYAESFHRDDRDFDFNEVKDLADSHYFPAIQDAEEFGGQWLPFGVDVSLFRPKPVKVAYDAAFLGSMYPKRAEFIARIGYPLPQIPSVSASDARRSFELLADAYCSTRIFVNLPALSRLLVTKVTEVMACGTFLLTPRLDHPSAYRNMAPFEDRKHLVYYNADDPAELGRLIEYYTAHPAERDAIAAAGRAEVVKGHTLQLALEKIVRDADAALSVAAARSGAQSSLTGWLRRLTPWGRG